MTTLREAPTTHEAPTARRRRRSPLGSPWTPILFLAPAAAYILIFQAIPLLQQIYMSFTRTSLLNPTQGVWVGLENYEWIITDPSFQRVLGTTFVYVVVCVIGSVGIGLGLAMLLNRAFLGRGVARALITVPWAAPGIAVALIATWMFNAQYGIINRFLDAIGLGVPGGAILDSPEYALPAILVTTIWQLFPFTAVVLLSALQAVPSDLIEAAKVDGAGQFWTFQAVTWQVIKPTVGLLALLMTIWSIRRFELIWLMTRGGPVGTTETLVINLYAQAFESQQLGRAAAIGMVGVLISMTVVIASRMVARFAERNNA